MHICLAVCAFQGRKHNADTKANQRVHMAEVTIFHFRGNENLCTNLKVCDYLNHTSTFRVYIYEQMYALISMHTLIFR